MKSKWIGIIALVVSLVLIAVYQQKLGILPSLFLRQELLRQIAWLWPRQMKNFYLESM